MDPVDLLATAEALVRLSPRRPRQSDLKRAISTVYYAYFHALAACCANAFVGGARTEDGDPWIRVYRALSHGPARNALSQAVLRRFPQSIQDFGNSFIDLQLKREAADCNPASRFDKSAVLSDIADGRRIVAQFQASPASSRTALATVVLFQGRSG
jgi:hypothetical protein